MPLVKRARSRIIYIKRQSAFWAPVSRLMKFTQSTHTARFPRYSCSQVSSFFAPSLHTSSTPQQKVYLSCIYRSLVPLSFYFSPRLRGCTLASFVYEELERDAKTRRIRLIIYERIVHGMMIFPNSDTALVWRERSNFWRSEQVRALYLSSTRPTPPASGRIFSPFSVPFVLLPLAEWRTKSRSAEQGGRGRRCVRYEKWFEATAKTTTTKASGAVRAENISNWHEIWGISIIIRF